MKHYFDLNVLSHVTSCVKNGCHRTSGYYLTDPKPRHELRVLTETDDVVEVNLHLSLGHDDDALVQLDSETHVEHNGD